jgi:hypothetical protein
MIKLLTSITMAKQTKKFKVIEKEAINAPTKDLQWEGEEVSARSETKLEQDLGTGKPIIIRFFEFGANVQAFKDHKPTAQELFDSHRKGIEAVLWRDGLRPHSAIEPRLMFSKSKTHYRFIIGCEPSLGNVLNEKPQTLSQIAHDIPANTN